MDFDAKCYERIVETLHDGLYCVDRERTIRYWNRAAEQMTGFTAGEVVGKSCADNILTHIDADGNSVCSGECPLAITMTEGNARECEVYMHHKDGHRCPVSVRTSPLTDSEGNIIGGIELFTDISGRETHELRAKELEKLAMLDTLTQIANRHSIEMEIASRLEEKQRHGVPFGVFFFDVDDFKQFNDTYGHDLGDKVLQFIAKTIIADSRPFDVYGRWGGEEFLGIVRNVTYQEQQLIGERLRSLIECSYVVHGDKQLGVTVSIGGTLVREDDTVESLVKRADELMYQSKMAGRNRLTMDLEVNTPAVEISELAGPPASHSSNS